MIAGEDEDAGALDLGRVLRLPAGEPLGDRLEPAQRTMRLEQLRLTGAGRSDPGGIDRRQLGQERANIGKIADRRQSAQILILCRAYPWMHVSYGHCCANPRASLSAPLGLVALPG